MKTKIYKAFSIMLALAVILSTCICAIGTTSAATATYYASSTGNDETGTGTANAPFKTVTGAVAKAIADGYKAGDTVTIKIGTDTGAADTVAGSGMAVYEFDLVIESANPSAKSTLTYGRSGRVANSTVGTTTYKNIKLTNNKEKHTSITLHHSKSVVFESDVEFVVDKSVQIVYGTSSNNGADRETASQSLVIAKSDLTEIQFSNFSSAREIYTGAVNLTLNSTQAVTLYFNAIYLGDPSGSTTYKKLVNVNLESAAGIAFNPANATFEEGLNIINSTGITIDAKTSGYNKLPQKSWVINNETGVKDVITATETPGVFDISLENAGNQANKKYVVAVAADGTEIAAKDGKLNLISGTYTLQLKEKVYYVSSSGNDESGNGKASAPFKTVAGAVAKAIADGYKAGDTVTIKIGTDTGAADTVAGSGMAVYEFDLVIESANPLAKSTLTYGRGGRFANSTVGVTTFKNVKITNNNEKNTSITLYRSKSVVFESDVEFALDKTVQIVYGTSSNTGAARETAGQSLIIRNSNLTEIQFSNFSSANEVYTEAVGLTLNSTQAVTLYFNAMYLGNPSGATKYKKLVNVNIERATGVTLNFGKATFEEGINVINSSGAAVAMATGNTLPENSWVINNETGVKDVITATETAGSFVVGKVNPKKYVVVVAADGTETEVKDGQLTLAAGTYTIKLKDKVGKTATYYVTSTGNDETGTGKAGAPLKTTRGAVAKAIADGYTGGDTITIKVGTDKGTADAVSGGSLAAYDFDLIIESANPAAKSKIKVGRGERIASSGLALTTYKNIIISNKHNSNATYSSVGINGSNVKFEANVTFDFGVGNVLVTTGHHSTVPVEHDEATMEFGGNLFGDIHIGNFNKGLETYTGTLNFIFNGTGVPSIDFTSREEGSTATYKKLVNFFTNKSSGIKFTIRSGFTATFEEGVNIINSGNFTVTPNTEGIDKLPANKTWAINNQTGDPTAVTPTTIPGEFIINYSNPLYTANLVDAGGKEIEIKDGKVKLTAGIYTLRISKVTPETATYYVSGAEGGNGTEARPFESVAQAIDKAKANGMLAGDTVIVKVIGENSLLDTFAAYDFKLIVEGVGETPARINFEKNNNIARNNVGDVTVYENVEFYTASVGRWLDLQDNNVVFGENVVFNTPSTGEALHMGFGPHMSGDTELVTVSFNQTATFKGQYPAEIILAPTVYGYRMYKGTLTLNLEGDGSTNVYFNSKYSGDTTYTNLVINLEKAKNIAFNTIPNTHFTADGGLYIINSSGLDLTKAEGYDKLTSQKYIINNLTGNPNLISVADEFAGKIKVNADPTNVKVIIKDAEGKEAQINAEGYATLNFGVYSVKADCVKHTYDNNCDTGCNICGKTRTPEAHVYDDATDTICNVCDAVRSLRGTGLYKEEGVWYYYEKGVKFTATTLVKYEGKWFYVVNGKWDSKITNTLVKYEGKYFWIKSGKWDTKTNDLVKYSGKYFLIKNGKWDNKVNTLYKKNGSYFYIKSGKWANTTTTIFKYSGKNFYIEKGKAQLKFSGKVKINGKTYKIKAGKVV